MISREELNRARWAARRGMLELDLVLGPFVEARYAGLEDVDRGRFRQLMRCEDRQLYAWLLCRERPADTEVRAIVDRIVEFAAAGIEHR